MKGKTIIQSTLILSFAAIILPGLGQSAGPPVFPAMDLGQSARGAAIISNLGNRLPEVAQFYGMTETALGALCLRDRDLRVDRFGKLLFACPGVPADAAQGGVVPDPADVGEEAPTADNAATDALLNYPASQTFFLHSKPGCSRVIHLDFNGHTTTGTQWNASYTGGAPITTPAYDTEGTPTSFSSVELANIQEIWKRISEDYAPWEVDVTTEQPPFESLRKTDDLDTAYGVRVLIGGSSNDWFMSPAGGVAYLRSFSWNSDTPCFVFPAQLGNGDPKFVAEASSHETGHCTGLSHDGAAGGTIYYAGHGDFPNSWAPIMGNSYYSEVTQFSRGEYTGANNLEDDLAIIDTYIPRSPDLAGDDILTAVPLAGPVFSATGLIQSRTDADLYRVDAAAGTLNFTVSPASPDSNLDISLGLYNGAGSLLTSSNPAASLGATLNAVVSAGTYYLAVDGAGFGTGSTGYTDYDSLGQFSLSGTLTSTDNRAPVAVVSQTTPVTGVAPLTVNFSSAGSSDPEGSLLRYDWDFGNGVRSTAANPQYIYITPGTYTASLVVFDNGNLSNAASVLISVTAPPIGPKVMYVSNIAMTKTVSSKGTSATAVVTVRDGTGAVKSNATVSGAWTGLTTATTNVKTNSRGNATFKSATTKNNGTFFFRVNNITLSGFTYDATKNVETTDSILK
jgi:PKD repeat protein